MNRPRIADAMEYIDEDMIAEAAEYRPAKTRIWKKTAAAACLFLCVAAALALSRMGMGDGGKVYNIAAAGDSVYFSVYNKGAFFWEPSMKKAEKLADDGVFYETESGIILYSASENMLWHLANNELEAIGKTDVQSVLENPELIGIYGDYAYWVGNRRDLEKEEFGMAVVRTSLHNGKAESLIKSENGSIADCALRDHRLYYRLIKNHTAGSTESLYTRNIVTGEEMRLMEAETEADGLGGKVFYGENHILIVSGSMDGIYRISYSGGEGELLSEAVPVSAAMDELEGKICFVTSFGENESEEFLSGKGFYREALVSLDEESGALSEFKDFELNNDNGTVRYTITELQMADNGFYFVDPHHGLLFHSYAGKTEIPVG